MMARMHHGSPGVVNQMNSHEPTEMIYNAGYPILQSQDNSPESATFMRKRKRSQFESQPTQLPDFVTAGLVTIDQAQSYFSTFFQGCDHYVPIFDPQYDTMDGIRSRSSLLFGAICTVGCRVLAGSESNSWRILNFQLKRILNYAVSVPNVATLETVQALLVCACYSAERSLLVAAATRMAVDLGLPEAYDTLNSQITATSRHHSSTENYSNGRILMRKARTWLHVLVLGHILHVDAGDILAFKYVGDVRRSRIFLETSYSTVLDRFLFAQVELNVIRANIFKSVSVVMGEDDDSIMDVVRDSKLDIELWFTDWERIFQSIQPTPSWLLVNLQVQKCWAETMAFCRAVKAAGVENVDFMSETQREILHMAKDSLKQHLSTIITQPRSYLHHLRYAMDFVWAKCAFCYLLLLKLSILLPDDDVTWNDSLVACGNILSTELSEAGEGTNGSVPSATGRLYLQLLQTGIEKFNAATKGDDVAADGSIINAVSGNRHSVTAGGSSFDAAADTNDINDFAPEQFLFEWDFPGLTLFSSSATGIGWLDDILLGALNGNSDLYNYTSTIGQSASS